MSASSSQRFQRGLWLELLICALMLRTVAATCLADGSQGFPLPLVLDGSGNVICPEGFHCPGFDPTNSSTYPRFCIPTPECQVQRMQAASCETAMGSQEPTLCPAGNYCPNATTIIPCPSDYYCPTGQKSPLRCQPLSICPAGSKGPFTLSGIIALLILCVFVAVVRWVYVSHLQPHPSWSQYEAITTNSPTSSIQSPSVARTESAAEQQSRRVLAAGFASSRGDGQGPVKIKFSNLSVSLLDSKQPLLEAVNGSLKPGTVTAILGPSGSGKTVLLKTLLGRTDANWVMGGLLTVNGDTQVGKYQSMIGSVPQDDILHTELTVYRNVLYAAQLRLPQHWAEQQRSDLIRAVLESLGLAHVADVAIGNAESRGVSGGQRKRTSIAVELVTAPQALLLDEPTKGLDSNTALELVNTLRQIAVETELTVGMAVNQPRREIWDALDELLILGTGGRTVFQGQRSDVVAYMSEKFGLKFSPESNPADVVLDAVSARGAEMAEAWLSHCAVGQISSAASDGPHEHVDVIPWNGASFLAQVRIAHVRYLEKQLSTLSTLYIEVGVSLLLGIMLGFSLIDAQIIGVLKRPYEAISSIPLSALTPQMHMYAFMSLGLATSTAGVNVFVNDKDTYARAVASGSSKLAHYIGTVSASWYRLIIVTLAFAAPHHLLSRSTAAFGQYFALFFVFSWVMYSVAGIVALIADQRTAALFSGVLSIVYACFSGFIRFPSGLKKISFCFWAAQLLQEWMYHDTSNVYQETSSEWGWELGKSGTSFGVMIAMGGLYHIIGCFLLMALGKP